MVAAKQQRQESASALILRLQARIENLERLAHGRLADALPQSVRPVTSSTATTVLNTLGQVGYASDTDELVMRSADGIETVAHPGAWIDCSSGLLLRGNGSNVTTSTKLARYMKIGRLAIAELFIVASSTASAGQVDIEYTGSLLPSSLPAATLSQAEIGTFRYSRGGTNYVGVAHMTPSDSVDHHIFFYQTGSTASIGVSPALTLTSGDSLWCKFVYETFD